jgi:hypothetical protein
VSRGIRRYLFPLLRGMARVEIVRFVMHSRDKVGRLNGNTRLDAGGPLSREGPVHVVPPYGGQGP